MRTRDGMALARAKGKLRGKKPKICDRQQKELRRIHDTGDYSVSDLAANDYRTLARQLPNKLQPNLDAG